MKSAFTHFLNIFISRKFRSANNQFTYLHKFRYLSSSGKDEKSDSTTEAAPDIKDEGKKKNSEAVTKLNKLLVQMAEVCYMDNC